MPPDRARRRASEKEYAASPSCPHVLSCATQEPRAWPHTARPAFAATQSKVRSDGRAQSPARTPPGRFMVRVDRGDRSYSKKRLTRDAEAGLSSKSFATLPGRAHRRDQKGRNGFRSISVALSRSPSTALHQGQNSRRTGVSHELELRTCRVHAPCRTQRTSSTQRSAGGRHAPSRTIHEVRSPPPPLVAPKINANAIVFAIDRTNLLSRR